MPRLLYIILILTFLGLVSSCFRISRNIDGKLYAERNFKNLDRYSRYYDKRENKLNKRSFKTCDYKEAFFDKDQVTNSMQKEYVYFQYDSIRVYISRIFFMGFLTSDSLEAETLYQNYLSSYSLIFENGLITGKSFYCELYDSCKIPEFSIPLIRSLSSKDTISSIYSGFSGPIIKILNIQDISKKTNAPAKNKRFEIWATTSIYESGWGSFGMFLLELENDNYSPKSDLGEFIEGAHTSCFMYKGIQY